MTTSPNALLGWISVDDRLPDFEVRVLAFRPFAHHKPANDENVRILKYYEWKDWEGVHAVTHWQPLPDPPA